MRKDKSVPAPTPTETLYPDRDSELRFLRRVESPMDLEERREAARKLRHPHRPDDEC
jgi:hypothetical protein